MSKVAATGLNASEGRIWVGSPRVISLAVTVLVHILGFGIVIYNQFPLALETRSVSAKPVITVYNVSAAPATMERKQGTKVTISPRKEGKGPELHTKPSLVEAAAPASSPPMANSDIKVEELGAVAPQHQARDAVQDYRLALFARLAEHRDYPEAARLRHYQGDGAVSFRIDRGGNLLSAFMERSTGRAVLDRAALRQVRRASPFPQIPPELPDELIVALPLQFLILPPGRQMAAR